MYLNFTSSRSEMELITRRVIDEIEEEKLNNAPAHADTDDVIPSSADAHPCCHCNNIDLSKYVDASTPEYAEMVERIRRRLGLTSLKFNTVEELVEAIGLPKERICTHCFDGTSYY